MEVEVFVTAGLGDNSYLVASEGEAVAVDPQRDAWRFLERAQALGVRVRAVLETHVHNDYASGALEVRAATGAEILAPAGGGYRFEHRAATEGTTLEVGGLRLVAWETPGHTPEHLSWLLSTDQEEQPKAVFSGGSLIVGSVGRTDLLGEELAETLARAQYRSVHRLAALPETVALLPTHGAGSFCTATNPTLARTSTLGEERTHNPALHLAEEEFVAAHRSGLLAYPAYYAHMASLNRAGPPVLGGPPSPPALDARRVRAHLEAGGWVVDARDRESFAAAHIPGSVNVELDPSFGTYVGWLLPYGAPLVLVLPPPEAEAAWEAATQLLRIGWDQVLGYLAGGLDAYLEAGGTLRSYPTGRVADLCQAFLAHEAPPAVLDVRQRAEWDAGHIPGSRHLFVGELPARLGEVPSDREWWVICASGHRAAMAASLLDRAGVRVRAVTRDGVAEWLARCYPAMRR